MIKFKNPALLTQALTHRSWVNEHKGERESNERLEFLGDAVLELIVSIEIFKKFPNNQEGYLTALRASLVNTENLAKVADKLDLGKKIYLSKGEENGRGRLNKSLLADTVEAIIGALYLDSGLSACEEFIDKYLLTDLPQKVRAPLKDSKSILQEYVQNKGFKAPLYKVVSAQGPDHAKLFTVEVLVNSEVLGKASGASKSSASQRAARKAILHLRLK